MMKKLFLCASIVFCAQLVCAQSEPIVVVDNLSVIHEPKGWRVIGASTMPVHFNLMKGDLIVRIDGRNAAETGPMQIASLFNEGDRRAIKLFVERGDLRMETRLRQIAASEYDPVGANPFKHVASGFSAPDVEFRSIDDRTLTLEQFEGKWLLIDFMATWCPPCLQTMPDVLSAVEHNDLSLNLLVVALDDRAGAVRRMQRSYAITSPIAMVQTMSQLPIDFGITTSRWTGQVPALVLIRPNGEVAWIQMGSSDAKRMEKTIQDLINGKAEEVLK